MAQETGLLVTQRAYVLTIRDPLKKRMHVGVARCSDSVGLPVPVRSIQGRWHGAWCGPAATLGDAVGGDMVDAMYREPNAFLDSDHPRVRAFAEAHGQGATEVERAVALYDVVRDHWRYNPYNIATDPADYAASAVLARDVTLGAHCIDKACVLAACARALGIPSRMHYANVRNHIGTAKLEAQLGTDLLVYHGYCELFLEGRWVAATPAFNAGLCEKLGVAPLAFDGREDSVFQPFDRKAGAFMEYVQDHGTHPGIPVNDMFAAWEHHYGSYAVNGWGKNHAD